jgi:hypothetical protein
MASPLRTLIGLITIATLASTAAAHAGTASNQAAAQADVASLLASVPLRAPDTPSATEPEGDQGVLGAAAQAPAAGNLASAHSWWISNRSPQTTLGLMIGDAKRAGTMVGASGVGSGTYFVTLVWPAVPGVLGLREVVVSVALLASGQTGIRADAYSVWIATRPASERIGAGVRRLSITVSGPNIKPGRAPVHVTSTPRIRETAALLNGLPLAQPNVTACPVDLGRRLRLTYYGRTGSRSLAVASIQVGGCQLVGLTLGGQAQPPLSASAPVGISLAVDIECAVGVHLAGLPEPACIPPATRRHH